MGLFAPAGTSSDLVSLLQGQIAEILKAPDVNERLATLGFDPFESTPEGLSAYMQAETTKWAKVVREANIKID